MASTGGRGRDPYYAPTRVADKAQNRAAIDAAVASGGLCDRTVDDYEERWPSWEAHCTELGYDPGAAPFEAYEALATRTLPGGSLYRWNTIVGLTSAVRHKRGGSLPIDEPRHARRWKEVRRGHAKLLAELDRAEGVEDEDRRAVPLMRPELQLLMETEVPRTPSMDAKRAAVLLTHDRSLGATALMKLRVGDILVEDGLARAADVIVECDHAERFPGVPWDCTRCAVAALVDGRDDDEPLFGAGPQDLGHFFWRLRSRGWSALDERAGGGPVVLVPRQGLSAWDAAGFRRSLVLMAESDQRAEAVLLVRARAWVALAWTFGLRMGSDVDRLAREAVSVAADGSGWRIQLGPTKDDPFADKVVRRDLSWDNDRTVSRALSQYLAVRDARVGRQGPLILSRFWHGTRTEDAAHLAGHDLFRLCRLAGMGCPYSSYSTRRGYAAQADADGWDLLDIQQGLRHLSPDTTVRYTGRKDGRVAVHKLLRGLQDGHAS